MKKIKFIFSVALIAATLFISHVKSAQADSSLSFLANAQVSEYAPDGRLVQFGSICGVGRNKSEAMTDAFTVLNSPYVRLQTNYSAYSGSEYTGKYLKGPYKIMGPPVFVRVSIIADYNWTSCIMVTGLNK